MADKTNGDSGKVRRNICGIFKTFIFRFILSELSMAEKDASMPSIKRLAKASSSLFTQSQSCFEDA